MFELTITKPDGSTYWIERFPTQAAAQKWLGEEITRKYWNPDFVCQIVDKTPPPKPAPTPEELAAIAAKKAQIATLRQRLIDLDAQADLTVVEVKECLRKLLKLVYLKGLAD